IRSTASRILVINLRSRSRMRRGKLRSVSRVARSAGSGKGEAAPVISVLVLSASPSSSSRRCCKSWRKNSIRSGFITNSNISRFYQIFRGLQTPIGPAGAAAFFLQEQVLDDQAPIHGFAHVVEGQGRDRRGGKGLHLHPGAGERAHPRLNGHPLVLRGGGELNVYAG